MRQWVMVCVSSVLCLTGLTAQAALEERISSSARALEKQVISWRRDIHQHPELSNREFRTGKLVAEHLEKLTG